MDAPPLPVRIAIHLSALAATYAQLAQRRATAEVAAVVKANAYRLGIGQHWAAPSITNY